MISARSRLHPRLPLAAVLGALALAAGARAATPSPPAGAEPRARHISYYYDAFEQGFARPVSRSTDPALLVRNLSHHHRECANVDAQDQVRLPSTWWQPRLGHRAVSVDQMLRGYGGDSRPAAGRYLVTKLKTQGVSPGLVIKDARGTKYAFKFDPPDYPELPSGADAVVGCLYWAAGYNVPVNSIVTFRRSELELAPDASYEDAAGRKRPLNEKMVDDVLARVRAGADGSYRVVASRWLPKAIGEWLYDGRRADDPEDLIPHELRREVRGLWPIYAWTNNTDCSARNTYDAWVTEGGRSFVRHYLIDFSGALGSASIGPQTRRGGAEYLMDYGAAARSFVTLGLWRPRWESAVDPRMPSVGLIESKEFDAAHWKPFLPNPAFDLCTERDMRWGARIVGAFTDEYIRAAVSLGKYSDPKAAEYLTQVLIERRDEIVRRWAAPPMIASTAKPAPTTP